MKTGRDLLDHGHILEGAEKLTRLQDCGRKAGCEHWHQCIGVIEDQWRAMAASTLKRPTARR
jgi:hypothetical protein